ncbi:uncharacterized protein LOC107873169 isoform X3 [Capsicum annuum]|uniref:uncharacterized protein LOC107873169 isoform X3 n=1 Tax=Capsicum annuum TaxID=4072 RepID=UPI0007BF2993|nr:uncharacterized protein LOC107873169 isoform X3 [Capsicum annuum]
MFLSINFVFVRCKVHIGLKLNIQSGNALNRIIAIETAIKQLNIQSGNALNRINAIEMAIEQLNIQSGNALNRLNAIEINFDAFRNVQGARNINLIESDDPQRRFMAQFGQRMAIEIDDYNFFAARQSSLNLILLQILAQLNGHVYILFF